MIDEYFSIKINQYFWTLLKWIDANWTYCGKLSMEYSRYCIQNFGQKFKFWSKIQILVKNSNFIPNSNFGKIQILVKNLNIGHKFRFWSKIKILVKNLFSGEIHHKIRSLPRPWQKTYPRRYPSTYPVSRR